MAWYVWGVTQTSMSLELELEALTATYGDDVTTIGGNQVFVFASPHTGEDVANRFVQTTLAFTVPDGYPATPLTSIRLKVRPDPGVRLQVHAGVCQSHAQA